MAIGCLQLPSFSNNTPFTRRWSLHQKQKSMMVNYMALNLLHQADPIHSIMPIGGVGRWMPSTQNNKMNVLANSVTEYK